MNPTSSQRWFRPPRPHGVVVEDRTVSFLELFYDLVYVVLIAQLAHTLAGNITLVGVRDFVVVFGLVWIAWINGTLYHDLHGGEDGRSRTYIFIQMSMLALLAVFAGHAADDPADGRGFAIVYSILLLFIAWQWFDVRRFDTPEWRKVAGRYVVGMVIVAAIVLLSAISSDSDTQVLLWAIAVALTLVGNIVMTLLPRSSEMAAAIHPTESLVERFGLFTIIVLGEVVIGVVNGVSAVDHTFVTIATGLLALQIGFGFWWNYFDFVGGRIPKAGHARPAWIFTHLPLAISISAAGAGMEGLVEHAGDGRTPASAAWLLGGATAGVALSIALLTLTINSHPARRAVPYTLVAAAAGALVIAAARPTPWLLALLLSQLLAAVWLEGFLRHSRHGVTITDGV
jgi:low temperature requirement protein LtrA